jgi:magnesium transporter
MAFIRRGTGREVPSIGNLNEIDSSSRQRHQDGAIYLSTPLVYRADSDQPLTTPVGFVLTRELLITVRFEELSPHSIHSLIASWRQKATRSPAPSGGRIVPIARVL